jgi:hypothetical protein
VALRKFASRKATQSTAAPSPDTSVDAGHHVAITFTREARGPFLSPWVLFVALEPWSSAALPRMAPSVRCTAATFGALGSL